MGCIGCALMCLVPVGAVVILFFFGVGIAAAIKALL